MRSIIAFISFCAVFFVFFAYTDNIAFNISAAKKNYDFHDFQTMTGFTVTAYCPGPCCNGRWAGLTATGISIDYFIERNINIIAVDPAVIPLGSIIIYDNNKYLAVDTGSLIKGNRLDVLLRDHESTEKFGIKIKQKIRVLKQTAFLNAPSAHETALDIAAKSYRIISY